MASKSSRIGVGCLRPLEVEEVEALFAVEAIAHFRRCTSVDLFILLIQLRLALYYLEDEEVGQELVYYLLSILQLFFVGL